MLSLSDHFSRDLRGFLWAASIAMALQASLRRASTRLAGSSVACYAQARNASSLKLPELPYDYRYVRQLQDSLACSKCSPLYVFCDTCILTPSPRVAVMDA